MGEVLLDVKDIHVFYGNIEAVKGMSFHVDRGEIVCLIGANGAGKTTTLRMLLGIIDPDAGLRRTLGHERPHEIELRILVPPSPTEEPAVRDEGENEERNENGDERVSHEDRHGQVRTKPAKAVKYRESTHGKPDPAFDGVEY